MKPWIKYTLILAFVSGLFYASKTLMDLNAKARIGVGYKVKVTCSEVFVAGRDLDKVLASDFYGIDPLLPKAKIKIDPKTNTVSGSLFGLGPSTARYRPEAGCTAAAENGVKDAAIPPPNPAPHSYDVKINADVQSALLSLFDDTNLPRPIDTRGALVVQNGNIIAEHYADGFSQNTRQQSWSMAKSVTSILVGIMVDRGQISVTESGLIAEWSGEDPRANITLENLLHMSSGLNTHEFYSDTNSDVVQMLFNRRDTGAFAAGQADEHPPGSFFEYSSATTNLISRIIRERIGNDATYHAFPRRELFDPLGMKSAIFEVDPEGNFIGSSYIYATPRDFARLGQLFLQGGKWNGEPLISQDWIDYSVSPGLATGGAYGAHWWLNQDKVKFPDMPDDIYYMGGNDGQYVIVIPSKNTVIVRLGITRAPATFETDLYPLLRGIYEAL